MGEVRGLRTNIVMLDDNCGLSPEVYKTIIEGFAPVRNSTIEDIRKIKCQEKEPEEFTDSSHQ